MKIEMSAYHPSRRLVLPSYWEQERGTLMQLSIGTINKIIRLATTSIEDDLSHANLKAVSIPPQRFLRSIAAER